MSDPAFREAPLRKFDFTSCDGLPSTLMGLAIVTLLGVGVRLLMVTIQQRRERLNRQMNERLRTLITAYKTLGGSFTSELTRDPTHLRDLRRAPRLPAPLSPASEAHSGISASTTSTDRTVRGESAMPSKQLSDTIVLGTEEQARLAAAAAGELAA